jgi:hypothetical protein
LLLLLLLLPEFGICLSTSLLLLLLLLPEFGICLSTSLLLLLLLLPELRRHRRGGRGGPCKHGTGPAGHMC